MIDFIIIGAHRAGTQSLYDYVIQHPRVVPAVRPDIHFFDLYYEQGLDWYIRQFPLLSGYYGARRPEGHITGEASPFYLHHPLVAERIKANLPGVKLIALLRNPTDRAYSHYRYAVRQGVESLSFSMALKVEAKRMEKGNQLLRDNPRIYSERNLNNSYISHGLYAPQVRRWMEVFPPEQLLFLRSEDYFGDPVNTAMRVYRFLGLSDYQPSLLEPPPVNFYEFLTESTRAKIDRVFAHSNADTCRLLQWPSRWYSEDTVRAK